MPQFSPKSGKRRRSLTSRVSYPLIVVAMGLFGYILWFQVQLTIRSNADQYAFVSLLDAFPKNQPTRDAKTTEAKALNSEATEDALVIKRLSNVLKQFAGALVQSYTADDGIAAADRHGFEIPLSKSDSSCRCDIVSIDCLDAIACMPGLHNPQIGHAKVWIGMQLQRSIKATAYFEGTIDAFDAIPLGKSLQYSTIESWRDWRSENKLPLGYNRFGTSIFVREDWYPDCITHDVRNVSSVGYKGVSCFYQDFKNPETLNGTLIEGAADRWYHAATENDGATKQEIRNMLEGFLREDPKTKKLKKKRRKLAKYLLKAKRDAQFSSFGNLIFFSHIMKILFNRRPFLDRIYEEKLTSVVTPGSELAPSETFQYDNDPFIVSIHMRRGDACGQNNQNGRNSDARDYQTEASPLDSKAQTGSDRFCYRTEVYLNALRRIRALVPKSRPIHVYLATDDVGHVVDEILNTKFIPDKDTVKNIFGVDKWHYLNYSRANFNYKADTIEDEDNTAFQPILGESAVADIWLLSHGHAFIGHLGSRFGKVSWMMAMARRNDFVPFFSVDGHSVCCEIDESCGLMKPYITVENCLEFAHEHDGRKHEDYFETGSLARKDVFLEHQEKIFLEHQERLDEETPRD